MSFPLPKLCRYLIILSALIMLSLTSSLFPVVADATFFTGTIDESSPRLWNSYRSSPHLVFCRITDHVRYNLHAAFTVDERGLYSAKITDYEFIDEAKYGAVGVYISSSLDMSERDVIKTHWQETPDGQSGGASRILDVGQTYYLFTTDCGAIDEQAYEAVNYTLRVIGDSNMELVPAIGQIFDQNIVEGASRTVDFEVVEEGAVSIGYQVFDKDDNIIPASDPFYSAIDNGNNTGTITFNTEIGDAAAAPYELVVTALNDENEITTTTVTISVVATESQTFTGTLDSSASFAVEDICGSTNTRYQLHEEFTPSADGIYTLSLDDLVINEATDSPYFAVVIISASDTTRLNIYRGWVIDDDGERSVVHANLDDDTSYQIATVDCGNIVGGVYTSADYQFTLTGPFDNTNRPIIEHTPRQYILFDSEPRTIDVNVIADDDVTITYHVLESGTVLNDTENVYSAVDNGDNTGTITILPQSTSTGGSKHHGYIISVLDSNGTITIDGFLASFGNPTPPEIDPIDDLAVIKGASQTVNVNAVDRNTVTLTYEVVDKDNIVIPDTDPMYSTLDTVTINPTANDGGTYRIIIEASDGFETRWGVFNLTVDTAENEKPVFDPIANVTLLPNEQETVTINATDPEGEEVSYRVIGTLPNFITWDTDNFTIAPTVGDEGSHRITVEASDGIERRWARFTVTVGSAENQKPVFEQVGDYWIAIGNTEFLPIIATDPEGADLTFRVIGGANNLPDFIRWNPTVPRFRIAPQVGDNGTYTIRVEASDGDERRWMTFRVRVVNPPS